MEEEWTELFSEKHQRKYWKNKSTGQTTWKNPNGENTSQVARAKSPAPGTTGETLVATEDEWQELFSEKHQRKYWKNKKTGQSSWKPPTQIVANTNEDKPAEPQLEKESSESKPAASSNGADEWEELFSQKHNRKYWKNKSTGKTSWTKPDNANVPGNSTTTDTAKDGDQSVTSASRPTSVALTGEGEWVEAYSEKHKRKYWKNKTTGKTSWTKPVDSEMQKATTESARTEQAPVPVASSTVTHLASDEWEEKYSEKHGKKYWKNKVTGKSSWTAPISTIAAVAGSSELGTSASIATTPVNIPVANDVWEELFSQKHNRKYWKNKETGKTTWTKPDVKSNATAVQEPSASALEISAVVSSDWVESYSEKHKRKYWKNKTTGKTTWHDPNSNAAPAKGVIPSALVTPAISVAPSLAPSLAPSIAPSAVPSTVASPLTVSSDVAKVAENKLTFRSICFIPTSSDVFIQQQAVTGSHFLEVIVGEQDTVTRTLQIQHQPVVIDTAESILPSMEHFPEKGCNVLDEWSTNNTNIHDSHSFAPYSMLTMNKQIDVDQGITNKTDILFPGVALLPKIAETQLRALPGNAKPVRMNFFEKFDRFVEAYETTRILGDLIELEAAFAVGDSSSYKQVVPESNITAEMESKENAVLFHLTDYKKAQVQNESLQQQLMEDSSRKFPTSGILSLKITQSFQNKLSSSASSFIASGTQNKNDIRWMPCWIDVNISKRCIQFHEQGPKLPATFTLSLDTANVHFQDLQNRSTFELELTSCHMIATVAGTVSTANNIYSVRFNFSSLEEMSAWYYTFALASFGDSGSTAATNSLPRLSSSFSLHATSRSSKDLIESFHEPRSSLSEKLLQLEKSVADRDLALLNLRSAQVSSLQLKSTKLKMAGGRVIVQAQGKCTKIPAGSIIISMNGISAIDLPAHTVNKFVSELPKLMSVHVVFMRPVSVQYSAEMMVAIPPRAKSSTFSVTEESPFSRKTFPTSSSSLSPTFVKVNTSAPIFPVDPIATKIANQVNFDESADWLSCQVLILGDMLTVTCLNTPSPASGENKGPSVYRFNLLSSSLTLSQPSFLNARGMQYMSSIMMELVQGDLRLRLRVPIRSQYHAMLRSLIAAMKLYGGIAWDLDLIRSLNDVVLKQSSQMIMAQPLEQLEDFSARDITSVSVLLSQSQLEASLFVAPVPSTTEDHNESTVEDDNKAFNDTSLFMKSGQSVMSEPPPPPPLLLTAPHAAEASEESVIDAAESLQSLLRDLQLPPTFPTVAMIEKAKQEVHDHARRNIQLMANFLSAQVEACYPASVFSKISVAVRDSEMTDEIKENDGMNDEQDVGSNNNTTSNSVVYDELGYLDGEEGALVNNNTMRRRASLSTSSNSGSVNNNNTGNNPSSNAASIDAMQQRQFNKAARRASRLSISMDVAAAQMYTNMPPGTSATGLMSSTTSSLSRTMLKNASKLSSEERNAISTLLRHFRVHPHDLLLLSSKLHTFQDLLSFSFIVVQRLFNPLSTDQNSIEELLKAAFQLRTDVDNAHLGAAYITSHGHHVERVAFFVHESRVIQSFDDFSQILHQKLMFSHHKYAQQHNQTALSSTASTATLNKVSICLLYELYCQPDIISFLEGLIPRLTTDSLSPTSGVADICSNVVEPICSRLYDAAERKTVPPLLKVILRAIHRHSDNLIHAEDFMSIILTPYVCNSLVDSQMQRGLAMDPASQHVVHRIRDLLFACFDHSLGKKLHLSLSDSAALSRSRWFISRALDVLVEDERPFLSSGIAKLVLSPVARLAGMCAETNRPKVMDSFVCLKPSELLYFLKIFDLSSIASSLLVTTSRAVSQSMSTLSSSDLMSKLSSYVIINPTHVPHTSSLAVPSGGGGVTANNMGDVNGNLATMGRRSYYPTALDRDVAYIFDLGDSEKDKDVLLDLLDDEVLINDTVTATADRSRNYYDVGSSAAGNAAVVSGGSKSNNALLASNVASSFYSSDENSIAMNELQVIHWLLTAARTSLQNIFENVTKVHSIQTVRELRELRDKLSAKVPTIQAILSDWQALQLSQEILRSHQAHISLIDDIYKSRKMIKNEFFKGPSTMMGPPVSGSTSESYLSTSSGRFPVLIAATRMIYVDYIEIRPLTFTVTMDDDKEHLLIQILRHQMSLDSRLSMQRLSDALQPYNASTVTKITSPSQKQSQSPIVGRGNYSIEDSPNNRNTGSFGSARSVRNMNPLWVIMQNVFPSNGHQDSY